MPATTMHLLAGNMLFPGGSDLFFLGTILPDCVDRDRALKDKLHFRTCSSEERLPEIAKFTKEKLDIENNDLDFGYLWHFFLDREWDEGPQKEHKKYYVGENWFLDYRKEIGLAGSYIANHSDFVIPLWKRLIKFKDCKFPESIGFPEDYIKDFIESNYKWHTTESIGPSKVFTPEITKDFIEKAIMDFKAFLNKYFPDSVRLQIFDQGAK